MMKREDLAAAGGLEQELARYERAARTLETMLTREYGDILTVRIDHVGEENSYKIETAYLLQCINQEIHKIRAKLTSMGVWFPE